MQMGQKRQASCQSAFKVGKRAYKARLPGTYRSVLAKRAYTGRGTGPRATVLRGWKPRLPGILILMKNALVLLLVVLFVSLPSVVFAKAPPLREAARDAERDAEHDIRSGSWFAFGFFCGGIGVLSAYLSSPSPDPGRLVGKSPAYVESYMWIYGPAVKERRLKSSIAGCLTMSAFSTFYWATR